MHFTFTDYIDGITQNSVGIRAGNSKNDKFMMSSVSVHYDFYTKKKGVEEKYDEPITSDDLLTMDYADSDSDGVVDTKDNCPGTPRGVEVDVHGCPLDDDMDGVPNYLDKERNTPKGAIVDENGVQMSDSLIAYRYNVFMDSTGAFAKVEVHEHNGKSYYNSFYQKDYMVSVGTFKKALPAEVMTKILSINDVSGNVLDDSTAMYTVGKYTNALDAEKRKQQLINSFPDANVVFKQKGVFQDAPVFKSNAASTSKENITTAENKKDNKVAANTDNRESVKATTVNDNKKTKKKSKKENKKDTSTVKETVKEKNKVSTESINTSGIVYRVQLGAFHKRLPKSTAWAIGDLIEIKTEDGVYKYTTGSFIKYTDAVNHKEEMMQRGYKDAFITAYKDGKRISLADAGAVNLKSAEVKEKQSNTETTSTIDKKNITFKIQLGKFKNQVPADKLDLLTRIKDIKGETADDGATRYVVGSFTDYKQAQDFKNEISKMYGLTDAFIIAYNNSDIIPVKQALEIINK